MNAVDGNMYEFKYSFSFTIKDEELINVAYFAALTIDYSMLSTDYMGNFDNSEIRYFQGPISSEKVFVDGAIQTKTNVFFLPDNTIWSGPVHFRDGNYMAGAFHKPQSHQSLRLAETQNLKLKDKRVENFSEKQIYTTSNRQFIGTPYNTRDENNNVKRLLSFDIEAVFLSKTKYGSLIKSINKDLFDKAISNFKIQKLNIKRKFVKKITKTNSFKQKKKSFEIVNNRIENAISFTDLGTERVVFNDDCEMVEIQSYNNKYRYFSFVDKKIKNVRYGNYIHSVELSFIDQTKELLITLLKNYRNDITELEKYLIRSNKKGNSDINNDFTTRFYDNEFSLYGLDNPENASTTIWLRSPDNYSNLKAYLFNLSEADMVDLFQDKYNSINPKTGTSANISDFIQSYRTLINTFKQKFKIDNIISGGQFETNPRKSFEENPSIYIKINKNYEHVYSQSKLAPGYNILEPEDDTVISINNYSRETFENRIKEEKDRFFKGKPNLDFEESKTFSNDEISSLVDIDTFSTSYLSPSKLVYGSTKIDLSQTSLVNTDLLNKTISDINGAVQRVGIFGKNPTILKLRNSPKNRVTSDNVRSFEDASEYLGDESEFLNLSSEFATEDLDLIQKILVKEKFMTSLKKKKRKKLIKNFDLKKQNNVISKKKRMKKKLLSRSLRKIPNHLKAVITSRANTVKTNLLTSVDDLLAGDKFNNALMIQHFAVQQIEYLDGYVLDKNGNEIFDFPNWKQLDSETFRNNPDKLFICRASQYVDELLEISVPEDLSFEVYDKYFTIMPSVVSPNQSEENSLAFKAALALSEQQQINYDYSTTNPVSQPIKENSIFTDQPQPDGVEADVQTSTRSGAISSRQRRGSQRAVSRAAPSIRGGGY
jgi:hypothetical protein